MNGMYEIALCDDDTRELDRIEDFLTLYQKTNPLWEYETQQFKSAEALLARIQRHKYTPDLLLLDIFMQGKTGIEAAQELRKENCDSLIIFLSTSREHALEAYGVDAIQYLVKPLEQEKFFHAMDMVSHQIAGRKERQIVVKVAGGGIRQLGPDEIIYCESQRNYQILHLTAEECRVRMTVKELWEILEQIPQFCRCGRSYILNLNHVVSVEKEEILMKNERTIYIPRNIAAEFKKDYFSYYFSSESRGVRWNT